MTWNNVFKVSAIIALVLLLAGLAYFLYLFKTNIDMFQRDPLKRAIEFGGYDGCSCTKGNQLYFANSTTIWLNPPEESALQRAARETNRGNLAKALNLTSSDP